MSSSIFRKKVLSQLSSPDQLDSMIAIERPRHWLIGVVLFIACVAVASWSVYGEITDRVSSSGILITAGASVSDVSSTSDGQVEAILVNIGDTVVKDQEIAILTPRDIDNRIEQIESELADRQALLSELEAQADTAENVSERVISEQKERLEAQLELTRADIQRFALQLEERQKQFEDKIITQSQLEQSRQQYQNKLAEEKQVLDRLGALERESTNVEGSATQQLGQLRVQVSGLENQLAELKDSKDGGLVVKAPKEGTVLEIKTSVGAILATGRPILSIETSSGEIDRDRITFLNFVPPTDGKKVSVGQPALISLSSADPSDYGKVRGIVTSISTFPVSLETVTAKLANADLARGLFNAGAPYEVTIELQLDPELEENAAVENKFQWTAAKGSIVNVTSGTYAMGEIIFEVRSPITLFIPILREWLQL